MNDQEDITKYEHPYYATHGCYYVGDVLGHHGINGYDGQSCHHRYASWQDFKDGKPIQFSTEDKATRMAHGVPGAGEEISGSTYNADIDMNLIYRWDAKDGTGCYSEDEDENVQTKQNGIPIGKFELDLFYVRQRKGYTTSITIMCDKQDQAEIKAWLWPKFVHLLRLWAPISGWPLEDNGVNYEQAIEHAGVSLAVASKFMTTPHSPAADCNDL